MWFCPNSVQFVCRVCVPCVCPVCVVCVCVLCVCVLCEWCVCVSCVCGVCGVCVSCVCGVCQDEEMPLVFVSVFIEQATPFLEEFLERLTTFNYPTSRMKLFIHNNVSTDWVDSVCGCGVGVVWCGGGVGVWSGGGR